MIRNLTLALAFFGATALAENEQLTKKPATLEINKDRLIEVIGAVDGTIINKSTELLKLAEESLDPIYVLINSPGGSVRAGNIFIDAMNIAKARGITVKCVSPVYAASMAFSILMDCSERYALKSTTLLFHPVRVIMGNVPVTAPVAVELAVELDKIDTELKKRLVSELGLDEEVMTKAYYEEKWWDATELQAAAKSGWITIVEDIKGTLDIFRVQAKKNKKVNDNDKFIKNEVEENGYAIVN